MQSPSHDAMTSTQTTCCIVGGGPAGVMLALLLARQDVPVVLLEAHMDFNREFRGDTIHPSVLHILDQIGLSDRVLQLSNSLIREIGFQTPQGVLKPVDFKRLKRERYPYIAMIPQEQFLPLIVAEAQRYPSFRLIMGAQVDDLLHDQAGNVCGVRYRGQDGVHELQAVLTVATDGRFSRIRKLAGFEPIKTSPPMDVLWFRLSRKVTDPEITFGRFGNRMILAVLNRGDYWQVGYVIPKGNYQQIRSAGIEAFHQAIVKMEPIFADRVDEIKEWRQISVLSVESSRIPRWYQPGLLLIGDAAHVMSPVGGVGINYAIQDAVTTSNILGKKLRYGIVQTRDLAEVQRKRELPTRFIQTVQGLIQKAVFAAALDPEKPFVFPPAFQFVFRTPGLRLLPALIIGYGLWPAHVETP